MERLTAVLAYDPGPAGAAFILLLIAAATGYGFWRWWFQSSYRRKEQDKEILTSHRGRKNTPAFESAIEEARRPWRGLRSQDVELGRAFGDDDARAILGRLPR